MQDARTVTCDNPDCGRAVHALLRADLADYSLPAVNDTRIYRCQTCVCSPDDALDPIAIVGASTRGNQRILGIRNVSDEEWEAKTSRGVSRTVPKGGVIPLKDGISFTSNGQTIQISAYKN